MTDRPGGPSGGAAAASGCTLVAPACATASRAPSAASVPAKVQEGGTITVVGASEPHGFKVKIPDRQTDGSLDVMASGWRGVWRVIPDSKVVLNADLMVSEMTNTDPQTVVYKIHPEAVWSDGAAVDADDFVCNWQTARPGPPISTAPRCSRRRCPVAATPSPVPPYPATAGP